MRCFHQFLLHGRYVCSEEIRHRACPYVFYSCGVKMQIIPCPITKYYFEIKCSHKICKDSLTLPAHTNDPRKNGIKPGLIGKLFFKSADLITRPALQIGALRMSEIYVSLIDEVEPEQSEAFDFYVGWFTYLCENYNENGNRDCLLPE